MTSEEDVVGAPSRSHLEQVGRKRARENARSLSFPRSTEFSALIRWAAQEGEAAGRLVGVVPPPSSSNPFALQSDTLRLLENLLLKLSPRHIVEFGSGASTVQFARWGAQNGATLLSIEHDRGWVESIRARLSAAQLSTVELSHSPLRLTRRGPRLFLTYGCLPDLDETLGRAGLILIDGPHVSGRELVLYTVLASCSPGSVIVIDDYRHYAIRAMLAGVGSRAAACFVGEAIDENSHGVFVLRCERRPGAIQFPTGAPADVLRSYWRCLRDYRSYGTGA